jgi:hypothetical protein
MNLLRRMVATFVSPETCPHGVQLACDCAGCQADRSLAPTWPADHVPVMPAAIRLPTSREPDNSRLANDPRIAA